MIDSLSPREYADLERAERNGHGWARVIRLFLEGARLRLGWDRALSEHDIERLAALPDGGTGEAIDEAVRWAVGHRLHLLGWHDEDGTGRWFMAVG